MVASSFVVLLVFQCLIMVYPALSQTIINDDNCNIRQLNCGAPGGPSNQKYCCAESNGGATLFKCCNPYIGLIVGLSVGVPLVILIIIGVVAIYCCCSHYQNRKMLRATLAYTHRQERERRVGDGSFRAPPPYTPTDSTKTTTNSDLPTYSIIDPYNTPTPPQGTTSEQEVALPQASIVELEDIPLLSDGDQNS